MQTSVGGQMETSGSADMSRQVRQKCNDVTLSKINSCWQETSVLPPTVRTDEEKPAVSLTSAGLNVWKFVDFSAAKANKQLSRSRWLCCNIWLVDCLFWDFVGPSTISLMCQLLFNNEHKYNLIATVYTCFAFTGRLALHLHCRQGPLPAGVKTFPSANTFWS